MVIERHKAMKFRNDHHYVVNNVERTIGEQGFEYIRIARQEAAKVNGTVFSGEALKKQWPTLRKAGYRIDNGSAARDDIRGTRCYVGTRQLLHACSDRRKLVRNNKRTPTHLLVNEAVDAFLFEYRPRGDKEATKKLVEELTSTGCELKEITHIRMQLDKKQELERKAEKFKIGWKDLLHACVVKYLSEEGEKARKERVLASLAR